MSSAGQIAMSEELHAPKARRDDRLVWLVARWAAWGALSFPAAVLLHELAHYAMARAFHFPGAVMHFGSAGDAVSDAFWQQMRAGNTAAAAALLPPWQVGLVAAAGLLSTYITVVAAAIVARRRPHPAVVGIGFVAPLRFIPSAIALFALLFGNHLKNGSDEQHVASVLPIPETLLHVAGLASLILGWYFLYKAVPRPNRKARIAALLAGIAIGGVLYVKVIGPLLLP